MRIQKGFTNLHSFSVTNAVKNRLGDKAWLNLLVQRSATAAT